MKRVSVVCFMCLSWGLSGCGGGGGGTESLQVSNPGGQVTPIDPQTVPENVASGITTISNAKLAQFADGASAVRFVDTDGKLYVGLIENTNLQTVLQQGAYTTVGTPASSTVGGVSRQIISATQNADGADLSLYVAGLYLSANETVNILLANSETNGNGFLAFGAAPKTIPSQAVQYSGPAAIAQIIGQSGSEPNVITENGTFTLSIDLASDAPIGTLTSSGMSQFQFTSSDVRLDKQSATLSSGAVSIGQRNGDQQSATLTGSLFGSDSGGAAGIIRSTSNIPATYIGTFFGNR